LGGKEGPTVVTWESLSEHRKATGWTRQRDARLGGVMQVKRRGGLSKFRSFELSGKEISFQYDKIKSKEQKNKRNKSKKSAYRAQSV